MKDLLHGLLKWVDHNRYLVAGVVLFALFAGWLVGCDVKTQSLLSEDQKVTLRELEREVIVVQQTLDDEASTLREREALYNAKVESMNNAIAIAEADIAEKQEVRLKLIEIAGAVGTAAAAGTLSPAAGIAAAIQALTLFVGGGAIIDNRRKNRVIARLKNGNGPATPPQ